MYSLTFSGSFNSTFLPKNFNRLSIGARVVSFLPSLLSLKITGKTNAIESDWSAGGGIRTHERLRDKVLSLTPLTWLGDPCTQLRSTHSSASSNIYLPLTTHRKRFIAYRNCLKDRTNICLRSLARWGVTLVR